ncbi:hypothetical protein BXT86_03655 [candidate division WOR-3 bacterium 4484_100]|uniref:SsuA/THI5-like domain-containing protein n=1 Tax=candidate division WOR-3 bacterium 4484_100 TaxID=1936077 RepID=A0A1V4QF26_UNCW3|nr:MAG: hypothetical protein BXT86_03655 [candidate division WOR-3 bacterium 4484_100]
MSIKARERILDVLIILGVIGLLVVVGYPMYKESLPSEVRFGVDKTFLTLPFYIAKLETTRNYFGIEKVKPIFVEINENPLDGIKEGKYDVAVVPWYYLLLNPSTDGDTVKVLAAVEIKSGQPIDGIIIPPKSKIRGLRGLRKKRLGYLVQDEYFVNLVIEDVKKDFKLTRLQYVPLEPEELATVFQDNKVDALYLLEPYRGYMLYLGNQLLIEGLISQYLMVGNFPYGAVVMRKDFVEKENRLASIRAKNAIDASISFLIKNPNLAKTYVAQINGWEVSNALLMKIRLPEYQRMAEIGIKSVEKLQTVMVQRGLGACSIKPTEFIFERADFVR